VAGPGLFGGVFAHGGVDTGDQAWLAAMLHTEAALARALAALVAHRAAAASRAPGDDASAPAGG
jgi:hypothetical protein